MKNSIEESLATIGEYVTMVCRVLFVSIRRPPQWALIREQLYDFGVLTLPVVGFTGVSTGMVLSAQSFFQLADKGLASATGLMVGKAMMTELGPVLTAFMVTGRIGASMCAQLGTMGVTEQIDALRSMAVNPLRYLVAPRFIAAASMLPLLTIFSTVAGIFGGYMVAVHFFGMSPKDFIDPMPVHITRFDLFSGLIKAFVFGCFIVSICCFKGMTTTGGAEGVGRSTTQSVVICYSCILVSNFLLTLGMNIFYEWLLQSVSPWLQT